MKQEVNISNAEMIVMRVVWSLGEAKVDDVMKQVAERQQWSIATVKTLLGRLVKKEMLSTEKVGRAFIYRTTVSEADTIQLLTNELLAKTCATKSATIISDAIATADLTPRDVQNLIQQLQDKQTVAKIECDCLDDMEHCTCLHCQVDDEIA